MGNAPKLSAGIDLIDEIWGGLYEGGSYLVYGRAASNRDLIPLFFAAAGGDAKPCLYLSSGAAHSVKARARKHGIDLRTGESVEILHFPELTDPLEVGDDPLASALSDIVAQVERARPQRVVIDDFMPFVAYHSFDRFQSSFVDMLERIDAIDATLMLVMSEPANDASEKVIDIMRNQMTGALHIFRPEDDERSTVRRLAFLPNIGHAGRHGEREWDVRPWIIPSDHVDRSGRRFRFSAEAGTSPRQARWADVKPGARATDLHRPTGREGASPDHWNDSSTTPAWRKRPTVPSIRLGSDVPARSRPKSAFYGRGTDERSGSPLGRVPRIPLGRTDEPQDRPVGVDLERHRKPEMAHSMQRGTRPTPDAPRFRSVALAESLHYRASHTDREAFHARLQKEFLRHHIDHTPFVLVAMRMDRPNLRERRSFDFDFVLDLVNESLRDQDDMLVDLDRERLIVMLAESRADVSKPFFGRLKQRLYEEAPQQAESLMQSVSAIVVPNGQPFRTAEEFLTYALDED